MPRCLNCRKPTESNEKWCHRPFCQESKEKYQAEGKKTYAKNYSRQYKNPTNAAKKKNGRHCLTEGCGVALTGYNFYRCPKHQIGLDDYMMQRGVCL
jgi:hypothetical protein